MLYIILGFNALVNLPACVCRKAQGDRGIMRGGPVKYIQEMNPLEAIMLCLILAVSDGLDMSDLNVSVDGGIISYRGNATMEVDL